jgi:Na+/alanine symporter
MKPFLSANQRNWVAVAVLIVFSIFVAVTTEGDLDAVDRHFGTIVTAIYTIAFGTIPGLLGGFWDFLNQIPLVVLTLIGGAIYFTFRFDFINVRGIRHAIKVVSGKYDDDDNPGEVTHFQALSTALSATVGLGNIAGVAFAVSIGGPGAVFWMMFAALFGMASKFAECTLGQMYRKVDEEGRVQGGPMVYLRDGLAEIGRPTLGKYLAVIFAILCIGGSFGGGNMFQANQSFSATTQLIPWLGGDHATGQATFVNDTPLAMTYPAHLIRIQGADPENPAATRIFNPAEDVELVGAHWSQREDGQWAYTLDIRAAETGREFNIGPNALTTVLFAEVDGRSVEWNEFEGLEVASSPTDGGERNRGWIYGILMSIAVGLVIVGGIRRIGTVAAKIVPTMCGLYVTACLYIIFSNFGMIPEAVSIIIGEAFTPQAGYGGLVGVLIVGITRAAFSSEAGIGSAAIAHSAARTKEPVREGFVALLEPAIDTLIVCFMTGMVIVITGVYADPATAGLGDIGLTSAAFGSAFFWFPYLLSVAVILFAFSTMISWSYYGERCWSFLFGVKESMVYRFIFLFFIFLGSISSAGNVLDFSDLMLLSMAFPNILGVVLLSGKIKIALQSYWNRLESGEFDD